MNKIMFVEPIVIILISLLCITGCSKNSNSDFQYEDEGFQSNATVIQDDAVPTASALGTFNTDALPQKANSNVNKELYEKFLANEAPVVINSYNMLGGLSSEILMNEKWNGKAFLLSEFIQILLSEDSDLNVTEIKYSYIDTMDIGAEQLLVSITTSWGDTDFSNQNYTDYIFVINIIDGQLNLIFEDEAVFRYSVSVNKYGYIRQGSYTGYGSDVCEYRILTEDRWVYIYGEFFDCIHITPLKLFQNYQLKEVNLESLQNDGGAVLEYSFEEEGDMDKLYTYAFFNDSFWPDYVPDELIYAEDSPYSKAFEDAGAKFYKMSEIEDIVSQREDELGVTDKIKNADEPEWFYIKDISSIVGGKNN